MTASQEALRLLNFTHPHRRSRPGPPFACSKNTMTDALTKKPTTFSQFVTLYREHAASRPRFAPAALEQLPEDQHLLAYDVRVIASVLTDQVLSSDMPTLAAQLRTFLEQLRASLGTGHRPATPSRPRPRGAATVRRFKHTGRPPIVWNAGRGIRRWG